MRECDVIVPIYNAYDCLAPCIDSIIKNTDLKNNRLILINDKSPDERVDKLLKKYANGKNIILLENEKNLGFVGTVNKGMKYSKDDVLLLNSDTEVTENWLDYIKKTAYSEPMVASVTSLSNNATLVSVPIGLQKNELPNNMNFDEYGKLVSDVAYKDTIELPTAHGFCMYITRKALDTVGYFDDKTFKKGYGEENDFSYRCLEYGFKHLICMKSIVYHKESQSFTDSKIRLIESHEKILQERYPVYKRQTEMWCSTFPLKKVCDNIFYQINMYGRKNILMLIHDFHDAKNNVGGTTIHVLDLIKNLRSKYNIHVLAPEDGSYKIYSYFEKDERFLNLPSISSTSNYSLYNAEYKNMIKNVISAFRIDTIHIHHMIGHYFDIADVAKENNIKLIITLHDYYSLCPTINMLYMMEKCCIDIPQNKKDCNGCLKAKLNMRNNIVPNWQKEWNKFLAKFDDVIVPSENTKKYINKYYPDLKISVIEHGIDLEKSDYESIPGDVFNVAFVGVLAKHKGGKVLENLVKDSPKNIHYHLFGNSEFKTLTKNKTNYTYHGKYTRNELPKLLKENKINLICSLSIWPETYSYTLTEDVASMIPVLSFNIGAGADRIKKYKLGYLIPVTSSIDDIIKKIESIFSNKNEYNKVLENMKKYKIKNTKEMSKEYTKIYDENKLVSRNSENIESLQKIIEYSINSNKTDDSAYKYEYFRVINSLRWKMASKIKVPESIKKMISKAVKL